MAYTTFGDVNTYLGTSAAGDNTLITDLITRAQAVIDTYTGRTFEHSSVGAKRYFTVGEDTEGKTLYLDEDLCSTSTVVTDADGDADSLTENTDFIMYPRNEAPYNKICLLGSSDYSWSYTSNPEFGIEVTGKWAYSSSAPDDIEHACIRLAAYFYRQKDSQVFDVTAIPDAGIISMPKGIPEDVKIALLPYRRIV